MTILQVVWFALIGGMLAVYVILDGCDLGVGFWHLTCRDAKTRRALRAAIAPYWDGNEVWLIAAGALLFAAFPKAYAAVFSAFYLPLILLLAALILRAVSIDFAEQDISDRWRSVWEKAFGGGSAFAAFAFGFAAGNVLRGLPMDQEGNFLGNLPDLINPYAIIIGAAGMAVMLAHASYYADARLGSVIDSRFRKRGIATGLLALGLYAVAVVITAIGQPHLLANYRNLPALWALPALTFVILAASVACNASSCPRKAFALSSAGIAAIFATLGSALFPALVPSTSREMESLTVLNSSSSDLTLALMLAVTLSGLTLVVVYTLWVRRRFGAAIDVEDGY